MLHLAYMVLLIWVHPPVTITMIANVFKGHPINYEAIDFSQQGKNIKLAAIASEDQKFPNHFGLDFSAIKGAYEANTKGKKLRGGSTITQQTAKNVFLWQGRDWIRKGLEAYTSLLTELIWGKKRILTHYLNIAEMGEGVYGVKKAANHYYKTTPEKLTANQAAMIIASLPNPKKMNPNNPNKKLLRKQQWILKQMKILGKYKDIKNLIAD